MSTYYNNNQTEEGKGLAQKDAVYLPPIHQPQPPSSMPNNALDVGLKRTVPWLEDNRETKTPKMDEKQQGRYTLRISLQMYHTNFFYIL
jgi:hypothetical protein